MDRDLDRNFGVKEQSLGRRYTIRYWVALLPLKRPNFLWNE